MNDLSRILGPKLFFVTRLVRFVTAVARLVCPESGPAWVVIITFCKHLFRATLSWQAKAFSSAARSTFRESVRYDVDDVDEKEVASHGADMWGTRQGSCAYDSVADCAFIQGFAKGGPQVA